MRVRIARRRNRTLTYVGTVVALAAVAAAVTVAVAGYLLIGIGAAVLVTLGWLVARLRLRRPIPYGPRGGGPAPPGGAGVREPRRPLPHAPAGAAALEIGDEEEPGRAVASI